MPDFVLLQRAWATAIIAALCAGSARAQTTPQNLIDWGMDAYIKTGESLRVPGSTLFAETASLSGQQSGGAGGFAFVWPLSTQFRVQNSLSRLDSATYTPLLRQFSDEARARYWKTAGGGYRSGVSSGATLFYDDNAHMAVALMEAYRITADPIYLNRAQETYDFVLSGEDLAGGGGIYFNPLDHSVKETISTLQGARAALMLYQATEQETYFTDATRLYQWARTHTQQLDGLFLERYYLTGPKAGTAGDFTLVNAAGDGISVNLEFYASTGDPAYLQEAQRIATRSLTRYFNLTTGAINDEGFWAFELVDAFDDLSRVDGNPKWLTRIVSALKWLHNNRRDPNGHYGRLWGRGGFQSSALAAWQLNDQASVTRSYLHTGLPVPEPLPGDFDANGVVDAADLAQWKAGFSTTSDATRSQGDADVDYDVDGADFLVWQRQIGKSTTSSTAAIPEPSTLLILLAGAPWMFRRIRVAASPSAHAPPSGGSDWLTPIAKTVIIESDGGAFGLQT